MWLTDLSRKGIIRLPEEGIFFSGSSSQKPGGLCDRLFEHCVDYNVNRPNHQRHPAKQGRRIRWLDRWRYRRFLHCSPRHRKDSLPSHYCTWYHFLYACHRHRPGWPFGRLSLFLPGVRPRKAARKPVFALSSEIFAPGAENALFCYTLQMKETSHFV
jgi:hypothetical protein